MWSKLLKYNGEHSRFTIRKYTLPVSELYKQDMLKPSLYFTCLTTHAIISLVILSNDQTRNLALFIQHEWINISYAWSNKLYSTSVQTAELSVVSLFSKNDNKFTTSSNVNKFIRNNTHNANLFNLTMKTR